MFFLIVIAFVLFINLAWLLISDAWIRKALAGHLRAQRISRWALVLLIASVFMPIAGMATGLGNPLENGPWIWAAFFYLWLSIIFFWMLGMALLGLPVWGVIKLKKQLQKRKLSRTEGQEVVFNAETKAETESKVAAKAEATKNDGVIGENVDLQLTRRQLIRLGLVSVPPLLAGGGAVASWVGAENLKVYAMDLPVKDLPADLQGFTITHLSDIHYGLLTGRERVERIVTAANKLKSDLMVITGDLIDRELKYAGEMVATLSELEAPLGVHVCIGNHDKMEDVNQWVSFIRKTGMNLLLNAANNVDTGGTPLKLLGIDYSRVDYTNGRFIKSADDSVKTPENALKILLAHHPHAFDFAHEAKIPVTLAGHTHGGQVVLKAGSDWEIFNPGKYLFRYVDGIYRSTQGNTMFVHKGSGDWFPLRMGAPAEIVQLRLVQAS